jgi:DNA invertase Pin-like site-specific DNA recombinase
MPSPRELLPQKESFGFELRHQATTPGRAVVYCRVSTKKQAAIGHSLDAQLQIVNRFCGENNLQIIGAYTEIERAWRTKLDQRPQLIEALAHAKAAGAKLVISRLDRLSRNVSVVTGLLESRASFVVADAPWASEFTLLLLSAIAHEESRLISARMIEVRAEAKAAGRVWQHVSNLRPEDRRRALQLANEARQRRTVEHDTYVGPIAHEMRNAGSSLAQIALKLNERGLRTQRGTEWTANSVLHLLRRIGVAPAIALVRHNEDRP